MKKKHKLKTPAAVHSTVNQSILRGKHSLVTQRRLEFEVFPVFVELLKRQCVGPLAFYCLLLQEQFYNQKTTEQTLSGFFEN